MNLEEQIIREKQRLIDNYLYKNIASILIYDPLPLDAAPRYDTDEIFTWIYLIKNSKIECNKIEKNIPLDLVKFDFSDFEIDLSKNILRMGKKNISEFDRLEKLFFEAIDLGNNKFGKQINAKDLNDCIEQFKSWKNLHYSSVIINSDDKKNNPEIYKDYHNHFNSKYVESGTIFIIPEPELFGVMPIKYFNNFQYEIGFGMIAENIMKCKLDKYEYDK